MKIPGTKPRKWGVSACNDQHGRSKYFFYNLLMNCLQILENCHKTADKTVCLNSLWGNIKIVAIFQSLYACMPLCQNPLN